MERRISNVVDYYSWVFEAVIVFALLVIGLTLSIILECVKKP